MRRNSQVQRWDPERYRRNAAFVPALGQAALQLLAPASGERILDLGCGDGALTALIAERATVSASMPAPSRVQAARARGLEAEILDGARLPFAAEFDAVFSNAALHWMRDADAVIDGVWRALQARWALRCGMRRRRQCRADSRGSLRGAGAARP